MLYVMLLTESLLADPSLPFARKLEEASTFHLYGWRRRKVHSASVAGSYEYCSSLVFLGILPKAGPMAQTLKRGKTSLVQFLKVSYFL